MRNRIITLGIAALLCAAGLIAISTRTQQSDGGREEFLGHQAKAEGGDSIAQFKVGKCYAAGHGVLKNEVEAARWYRKSAEQKYFLAQYYIGTCYAVGEGVMMDEVEGVRWWRMAAEQNYPGAQHKVGFCYAIGLGVTKDTVEAYAWYDLAASAFEPSAEYRDNLEKRMSPQQIVEAKKRTQELRAQIDAKLKSGVN